MFEQHVVRYQQQDAVDGQSWAKINWQKRAPNVTDDGSIFVSDISTSFGSKAKQHTARVGGSSFSFFFPSSCVVCLF